MKEIKNIDIKKNIFKYITKNTKDNPIAQKIKDYVSENVESMDFEEKKEEQSPLYYNQSGLVFDMSNDKYQQFGGYQGSLYGNLEEFMESDMVSRIIYKYFDDYDACDKELLFYRMNSVGCGYIAAINIIMDEYLATHNELEFYETFGFPPYTLGADPETGLAYKDFNYEYMFLDFFLYYATNQSNFTSLEEAIGNTAEEIEFNNGIAGDSALDDEREKFKIIGMHGTKNDIVGSNVKSYLNSKGLNCETINNLVLKPGDDSFNRIKEKLKKEITYELDVIYVHGKSLDGSLIKEQLEKGNRMTVAMHNFSLYLPYDKDGNGLLDDIAYSDVGPHGMTVVETIDENKIMVSSWGNLYIVDLSIDPIDDYTIYDFNFNNN